MFTSTKPFTDKKLQNYQNLKSVSSLEKMFTFITNLLYEFNFLLDNNEPNDLIRLSSTFLETVSDSVAGWIDQGGFCSSMLLILTCNYIVFFS